MKNILILGAGLSSSSLIRYLLQHSENLNIKIRIVDQNLENIFVKTNQHPRSEALVFDALDKEKRLFEIEKADIVISMLPAKYHVEVAKDCLEKNKHLITPSYVTNEMKALSIEAEKKGLIFLNEIGVDPGIDHMSACKIMDNVKEKGGRILEFKSYCGGLIAPISDDNPWHYKFTWNPRNVVIAGFNSTSRYVENNEFKYIPYHRLFTQVEEINIPEYGAFEAYANRDSLSYQKVYDLENSPTLLRGTLRKKGFCEAWNIFVQLGMTNPDFVLDDSENLTPRKFLNVFLPYHPSLTIEEKFIRFLGPQKHLFPLFEYLDLFSSKSTIGIPNASAAVILEHILISKWKLNPNDKDMLVMFHHFVVEFNHQKQIIQSYFVTIGENNLYTAMSNTVGLPMAICTKLIIQNKIKQRGVILPISKEIYVPVLYELEDYGIRFVEKQMEINSKIYNS
ncbi:MAG: saccharopine dehydrogenase NADP-binding domain-containing protein [Flavobacteriia bacterium]|nr:saccharopine dehydrogenase NADP-binding domain-containing protein [Flavobacteriia bacterium]